MRIAQWKDGYGAHEMGEALAHWFSQSSVVVPQHQPLPYAFCCPPLCLCCASQRHSDCVAVCYGYQPNTAQEDCSEESLRDFQFAAVMAELMCCQERPTDIKTKVWWSVPTWFTRPFSSLSQPSLSSEGEFTGGNDSEKWFWTIG